VLEAWSRDLSEDSSTILKVLATEEPMLNEYQEFHYGDVLITEALAASRNPADATKKLGISRQRLDYKLNRYGLK